MVTMNTPVIFVTAALTVAILIVASFLIATGTRGEETLSLHSPAARIVPVSPAGK
jgi:hypothetical protein